MFCFMISEDAERMRDGQTGQRQAHAQRLQKEGLERLQEGSWELSALASNMVLSHLRD